MTDESRIDAAIPIKLFLKGKDHQRFVDVFAQQAHPSLAPRPELRANVIDDGNAALVHLARDAPVESGRVDDDGKIRFALVGLRNQLVKQAPDFWQMIQNFGNSDHCKVSGVDDRVATCGPHAIPTHTEEFEAGLAWFV